MAKTPRELGYSFPPEWAPHRATWLSWPRPEGISFPGKYHTVPENLARIMCEIQSRERVEINVPNENYEHLVRQQLKEHGCPTTNVRFHFIKTNESWCRDHGPAFVIRRNPKSGKRDAAVVDWGFNAWGGKYPPYDDDDRVPTEVAKELKLPVFYPRMPAATRGMGRRPMSKKHGLAGRVTEAPQDLVVLEGGAVDFNGAGTILTTTSCLLNKNRNPQLNKKRIEQYLK